MGHKRSGATRSYQTGLYSCTSPLPGSQFRIQFSEFGLSHFGTDTAGVNATRRYLCEALSFQYRYVPIGLLETLPGRINDRAPAFRGRNELGKLCSFKYPLSVNQYARRNPVGER